MKKDVVIEVKNLSKKYQIGNEKDTYLTLRDQLMKFSSKFFNRNKKEEFWALKNINFEIKKGEVVGVIGRNGAGKSTLLKILSRIVEPTTGRISMKGKIASLLEVGTGFNPELTGRENIYLNGAILGMSKQEIRKKFNEISDFSGVKKFLNTPVKKYSSGMYVRLAFAVAAHLDSDILLVDEVLAVGDIEFQKKCLGKMNSLAKSGKTVLFVSHNIETMLEICKKFILLENGEISKLKETKEILDFYLTSSEMEKGEFSGDLAKLISFEKIEINKRKQNIVLSPEEKISIDIYGNNKKELVDIVITMSIYSSNGTRIFSLCDVKKPLLLKSKSFISSFIIQNNFIRPGTYYLYAGGYQTKTGSWFYGERLKKITILPKWNIKNKKVNTGLINLPFSGKRKQ